MPVAADINSAKVGKKLKQQFRILIYCGNGYSFDEYFKPLIENLISDCKIEFLQADYGLTDKTLNSLKEFSKRGNFSYRIVRVLKKWVDSSLKYHRDIKKLINGLNDNSFDLLIVSNDSNIIDRYLIHLARSQGAKVVVIHTNLIYDELLKIYGRDKGLDYGPAESSRAGFSLKSWIGSLPPKVRKRWRIAIHHYIFPAIFHRTVFPVNRYDEFKFTSGRADSVICYDSLYKEALENTVPFLKNIHLAQHPARYYSAPTEDEAPHKLLALLSGYWLELPEDQINFWYETIKEISQKAKIDEVHLRFHPRTDQKLLWPKKLLALLDKTSLKVVVVKAEDTSLVESLPRYKGVIGAMSGALLTARAVSQGFVVGLLNAWGGTSDQEWKLGKAEGINWIRYKELIKDEYLSDQGQLKDNRPTVSELIVKSLKEGDLTKKRQRILMYCGSGYSFAEYFKPLIEEMISDYDIEFLQGDYYLNQITKSSLEKVSLENENFIFQIVPVFHLMYSRALSYHRKINKILDILRQKKIDLFVVGSDCSLGDRYLIRLARFKQAKVAVMHINIMVPKLVGNYRKKIGLGDEEIRPIVHKPELLVQRNYFQLIVRKVQRLFDRVIVRRWKTFLNYYILPLLFSKTIFPTNKYDAYGFTSGRSDLAICYDSVDVDILKSTIPGIGNVCLTQHPSAVYSSVGDHGFRKLLVILAGHSNELSSDQITFWVKTIKTISEKEKLDEVHLRFHPRTDEKLLWPKKLLDSLSNFKVRIVKVDAEKVFLVENLANYIGVVGTVSGALRTARAVSQGFVLGLKDASGEPTDRTWMLGSNEGINWINQTDDIRGEYLVAPVLRNNDRAKVSQVLRKLLNS